MFFGSLKSDRPGLGRRSSGFVSKRFPSWRLPKTSPNPQAEHSKEGPSSDSLEPDENASKSKDLQHRPNAVPQELQAMMERPRRRKSLGNVVQTVRAKLSRSDKSSADFGVPTSTKDEGFNLSFVLPKINDDSDQEARTQPKASSAGKIKIPQLEVLNSLACGNLTTSSTFRDGLERAADDINIKYQNDPATVTQNDEVCSQNQALRQAVRGYRRIFSPSAASSRRWNGRSSDILGAEPQQVNSPSEPNASGVDQVLCSTKVPLHWIEKILEQSISLRTPRDYSQPNAAKMNLDSKSLEIESASVIKHKISPQPSTFPESTTPWTIKGTAAYEVVGQASTRQASVSGQTETNTQDSMLET